MLRLRRCRLRLTTLPPQCDPPEGFYSIRNEISYRVKNDGSLDNFQIGSNIKDSNAKANCITNTCGYTYNKLTCGNTDSTNGNDTTCSSKTTSSKESCQIVNQENYSYKVECTTSSTTIYPTTLPTTIMPGTGFEYQVKLYGNKTCTITFDTEHWKYNYAASYTDAERNNYMEKAYNIIKKKFGAEKANQLFVLNAKTLLNNNGE